MTAESSLDVPFYALFLIAIGVFLIRFVSAMRRGRANGTLPVQPFATPEELAAAEKRVAELGSFSRAARPLIARMNETYRPGHQRRNEFGAIALCVGVMLFLAVMLLSSV